MSQVYVTPDLKKLREFQRYLYKTGKSLDYDPKLEVNVGDLVLAMSSADKYWYRAIITKVETDGVTFRCPDFGFTETVSMLYVRQINSRLAVHFRNYEFLGK